MCPADVAGWIEAATLVGAYAAVTADLPAATSRRYHALNAFGSVGLAAVVAFHRAWPSLALNAMWLLIACASVVSSIARHLPGSHHTASTTAQEHLMNAALPVTQHR
jgi:hypothetical protein